MTLRQHLMNEVFYMCLCVELYSQAEHQKLCASATATVTPRPLALCAALMGSRTCPPASLAAPNPITLEMRLFIIINISSSGAQASGADYNRMTAWSGVVCVVLLSSQLFASHPAV